MDTLQTTKTTSSRRAWQTFYRSCALVAVIGGVMGMVGAPLLALSYFATAEGAAMLNNPTVAGWASLARPLLAPMLNFASPDTVYLVYTWAMAPVLLGYIAGLLALHARQVPRGGSLEQVGFWLALVGAALLLLGLMEIEVLGYSLLVPGLLLTIMGTYIFGIGTLLAGVVPIVGAWLLILGSLPGSVMLAALLGHNGCGLLLLNLAWIIIGLRLWWRPSA